MTRLPCDLLVHSAAEVLTMAGWGTGPWKEVHQGSLGNFPDLAIACSGGRIVEVGRNDDMRRKYHAREEIDAFGKVVMPGLVDAHTHIVFAGSREHEFQMRNMGMTYAEVAASGGGIRSSVEAFREATHFEILEATRRRRRTALLHGTTTMEVKSGYGLSLEQEIRALEIVKALDDRGDLVPTFLGAHAVPPEFDGRTAEYARVVAEEMIPEVTRRGLAKYCDVFCEERYFDVPQSRAVLAAAKSHGLGLRIHADELSACGGAELAAEMGCASADHLLEATPAGIAAMAAAGTVAVVLPCTSFFLGMRKFAPAREMIEAGVPIALATDCNPGSSMTENLQQAISMACVGLGLTAGEALVAATRNAAWSLGLGTEVGSIARGFRADLLVLDVPNHFHIPYHHGVNHVSTVVHHGEIVR